MSNYAFEGPKWSSSTITWSFASAGGSFTNAITGAYQNVVAAAFARWAQVANVTFQQVSDSAAANIRIGWSTFSGSQIGETDYSYRNGATQTFSNGVAVRLEDPAAISVGSTMTSRYQGTATTLYQVALHEIGHALGLAHSTDTSAVMYASVGPSDTDLGASDIQGIQTLYGAPAAAAAVNTVATAPITIAPAITLSGNAIAVYRFFDASNGTQFLTANLAERNTVLTTRPDLAYEGLAMGALSSPAGDANAVPVYRFFDTTNGSHFFTTSQSEAAQITATRADMVMEQTTFYEHATQQAGDVPVYRFFDSSTGTHFFTNNNAESTSLQATRPDMKFEGVAFYSPSTAGAGATSQGATTQGASQSANAAANAALDAKSATISISDDTVLVYRFDGANGQQILTGDTAERDTLLTAMPSFSYDGAAMGAVSPDAGDPDAAPVFRFFDAATGDHFLTASASEAASLAASRPDMVAETTTFYEHLTQEDGDVPVYRFFDTTHGTHLYTASETERASLIATRPDMAQEGIAFYAPSISST